MDDPGISVSGRVVRSAPAAIRFGYPGVTVRFDVEGNAISLRASSTSAQSRLQVLIDGSAPRSVLLPQGTSDVVLATELSPGRHSFEVVHQTETWLGIVTLEGLVLSEKTRLLPAPPRPSRRLLFIGDSVTCGEALHRAPGCKKDSSWWDAYDSYGMRSGRALSAETQLVCFGGRGLIRDWQGKTDVLNAPQFFQRALPDASTPEPWDHATFVPDAVIISLGTNDFNLALGPFPDRETFVTAYVTFLREIRARHPTAHVLITEGAIVNDADPARPQRTVLRDYLAETARRLGDEKVHVVPSSHYPGDACDAHPTAEQHAAMARDLEPHLRRVLGW